MRPARMRRMITVSKTNYDEAMRVSKGITDIFLDENFCNVLDTIAFNIKETIRIYFHIADDDNSCDEFDNIFMSNEKPETVADRLIKRYVDKTC